MITSWRKFFSDVSEPRSNPQFQTLFAYFSNSSSCVAPRSRGIGFDFRPARRLIGIGSSGRVTHDVIDVATPVSVLFPLEISLR